MSAYEEHVDTSAVVFFFFFSVLLGMRLFAVEITLCQIGILTQPSTCRRSNEWLISSIKSNVDCMFCNRLSPQKIHNVRILVNEFIFIVPKDLLQQYMVSEKEMVSRPALCEKGVHMICL